MTEIEKQVAEYLHRSLLTATRIRALCRSVEDLRNLIITSDEFKAPRATSRATSTHPVALVTQNDGYDQQIRSSLNTLDYGTESSSAWRSPFSQAAEAEIQQGGGALACEARVPAAES
jgi:hypothetical protein